MIELAWAAGLFDGEGTAGCYHRNDHDSYQLRMSISQKEREVLDRFQKALNIGKVYGPYLSKSMKYGPMYQYRVSGVTDIEIVYHKLLPYLSSIKVKQVSEAITLYWEMK